MQGVWGYLGYPAKPPGEMGAGGALAVLAKGAVAFHDEREVVVALPPLEVSPQWLDEMVPLFEPEPREQLPLSEPAEYEEPSGGAGVKAKLKEAWKWVASGLKSWGNWYLEEVIDELHDWGRAGDLADGAAEIGSQIVTWAMQIAPSISGLGRFFERQDVGEGQAKATAPRPAFVRPPTAIYVTTKDEEMIRLKGVIQDLLFREGSKGGPKTDADRALLASVEQAVEGLLAGLESGMPALTDRPGWLDRRLELLLPAVNGVAKRFTSDFMKEFRPGLLQTLAGVLPFKAMRGAIGRPGWHNIYDEVKTIHPAMAVDGSLESQKKLEVEYFTRRLTTVLFAASYGDAPNALGGPAAARMKAGKFEVAAMRDLATVIATQWSGFDHTDANKRVEGILTQLFAPGLLGPVLLDLAKLLQNPLATEGDGKGFSDHLMPGEKDTLFKELYPLVAKELCGLAAEEGSTPWYVSLLNFRPFANGVSGAVSFLLDLAVDHREEGWRLNSELLQLVFSPPEQPALLAEGEEPPFAPTHWHQVVERVRELKVNVVQQRGWLDGRDAVIAKLIENIGAPMRGVEWLAGWMDQYPIAFRAIVNRLADDAIDKAFDKDLLQVLAAIDKLDDGDLSQLDVIYRCCPDALYEVGVRSSELKMMKNDVGNPNMIAYVQEGKTAQAIVRRALEWSLIENRRDGSTTWATEHRAVLEACGPRPVLHYLRGE